MAPLVLVLADELLLVLPLELLVPFSVNGRWRLVMGTVNKQKSRGEINLRDSARELQLLTRVELLLSSVSLEVELVRYSLKKAASVVFNLCFVV